MGKWPKCLSADLVQFEHYTPDTFIAAAQVCFLCEVDKYLTQGSLLNIMQTIMMSDVTEPHRPAVIAVLSVKSPTGRSFWISVFLLLIFIQLFILSNDVLTSPFQTCRTHEYGELCETKMNFPTMLALDFYVSVALVAFALLTMLLAAYAKDRSALWCSMACQAVSGLLILIGIIGCLLLNQSYATWEDTALWYCICVGVQVELFISIVLTCVSGKRLTSDWE